MTESRPPFTWASVHYQRSAEMVDKGKVAELFKAGKKGREIAAEIGCKESAVWAAVRAMGLKRGHCYRQYGSLKKAAKRKGRVDFDEAPLPGGQRGVIAFIGDVPGCVCSTREAALSSALAVVE